MNGFNDWTYFIIISQDIVKNMEEKIFFVGLIPGIRVDIRYFAYENSCLSVNAAQLIVFMLILYYWIFILMAQTIDCLSPWVFKLRNMLILAVSKFFQNCHQEWTIMTHLTNCSCLNVTVGRVLVISFFGVNIGPSGLPGTGTYFLLFLEDL